MWRAQAPSLNLQANRIKAQAARSGSALRALAPLPPPTAATAGSGVCVDTQTGHRHVVDKEEEAVVRTAVLRAGLHAWKTAMGEMLVRGGYRVLRRLAAAGQQAGEAQVLLLLAKACLYTRPDPPQALELCAHALRVALDAASPWNQAEARRLRACALLAQAQAHNCDTVLAAVAEVEAALAALGLPAIRLGGDVTDAPRQARQYLAEHQPLPLIAELLWTGGTVCVCVCVCVCVRACVRACARPCACFRMTPSADNSSACASTSTTEMPRSRYRPFCSQGGTYTRLQASWTSHSLPSAGPCTCTALGNSARSAARAGT